VGSKGKKRGARKGAPRKNPQAKPARSRNWFKTIAISVTVVAGLSGLVIGMRSWNTGDGDSDGIVLPDFVKVSSTPYARKGYQFAAQYSDELSQIPCFCGCGQHSGHKSVHDCFIAVDDPQKKNPLFDEHGANCKICVDIVLDAVDELKDGKSLQEVRNDIEDQWKDDRDSMTPTPEIKA